MQIVFRIYNVQRLKVNWLNCTTKKRTCKVMQVYNKISVCFNNNNNDNNKTFIQNIITMQFTGSNQMLVSTELPKIIQFWIIYEFPCPYWKATEWFHLYTFGNQRPLWSSHVYCWMTARGVSPTQQQHNFRPILTDEKQKAFSFHRSL